jgi:hypothetical protein
VKSGGSLTLVDVELIGGALADPLVLCADCALDVQGGTFQQLVAGAVFHVVGATSDVSIRDTWFEDIDGSVLIAEASGFAELVNVTVLGGVADTGPGVVVTSGAAVDVEASWFEGNVATSAGGALFVTGADSSLLVRDTTFLANDGGALGGAVAVEADGDAQLIGCVGESNSADAGGAVSVAGAFAFSDAGTWEANRAFVGNGGAFWIDDGTLVSVGDRLSSNSAVGNGGGAWVTGIDGVLSISAGAVTSNFAALNAGGVGVDGRASLFLSSRTLVRQNVATVEGGGAWIESVGTFGSVGTDWSANLPDDFDGVSYTTDPGVIFCANGQKCLSF